MLCLGWQSDDSSGNDAFLNVNEQARRCVEELHAGGMILFARNVQAPGNPRPPVDTVQVRDMIAELQNLAKIPLFVAVDQEGGRVARFGAPFTAFPSAKVFGEANQWELAQKAAKCTAKELRAVGVNFNFAPVADINSNPANPVIGDRAFGDNVRVVTTMVISQLPGFYTGGVLSCVKHFPGHGDTDLDSHLALPMLTHSRKKMDKRELQPFKSAIELRVPAIMTAHILFPALDDTGVPATLSKPILTDLLRGELGFRGLIVTDCLQMKAVADTWGTARAAVMAAKAGADILLVCHTWERQKETFDALLAAVRSGELSEAQVNDSVRRILRAKANLPTGDGPPLSVIGSPAHVSVARQVCEAAGVPFLEPVVAPTLGESAL
ncbi:MAG: beta-N-acetylhexosaminidase [Akkermansiaceae bacterium]|nr:beta-N-acetylhexosaminidase [Armatimonadota bacterium]